MAKKEFTVTYPILGYASMTVEADDAESAEAAFWASIDKFDGDVLKNPDFDITEWDFVEHVQRGNVSYAQYNEKCIEEA